MTGKLSLIVIIGFSIIFGVASQYWNRTNNRAVENFVGYYDTTMAHNIAVSAANIAADSVYFAGWTDTLSSKSPITGSFSGGSKDNTAGSYTVTFKRQIWQDSSYIFVTVVSTYKKSYRVYPWQSPTINDTVKILFHPRSFTDFAFWSQSETGPNGSSYFWGQGDTSDGPFHTEGTLNVASGNPKAQFLGRVTAVGGINTVSNGNFAGGYQTTAIVSVPMPNNINGTLEQAPTSSTFTNPHKDNNQYTYDVYLTFNSNGTITDSGVVRYQGTVQTGQTVVNRNRTQSTLFGTNGNHVIGVVDGDVHIMSGSVVNGQVTVVAKAGGSPSSTSSYYSSGSYRAQTNSGITGETSTTTSHDGAELAFYNDQTPGNSVTPNTSDGNIIIEGNVTYNSNPKYNPTSTDMLGLVAEYSVVVGNQSTAHDVTVDAAIFARKGGWGYMAPDKTAIPSNAFTGYNGHLYVYGSITQYNRGHIATAGSSSPSQGFDRTYHYDTRFNSISPPAFPISPNSFSIISWRE